MSYRKTYEEHFGPIPVDDEGRTYDVHHKDRDRSNNDPDNLVALPIQEHYQLHYEAGEFPAAQSILLRIQVEPEEISRLARLAAQQKVAEGTHHFLGGEVQRRASRARVAAGTHHFQGDEHRARVTAENSRLVEEGQHPFQREESVKRIRRQNSAQLAAGTHPFQRGFQGQHSKSRIGVGTHHFQQGNHQASASQRAKEVNSYLVQRIAQDGSITEFVGVSDAVNGTNGATRKYIEAAAKNNRMYLSFRWFIVGRNGLLSALGPEDIRALDFTERSYNRLGNELKPKSVSVRRWKIINPQGEVSFAEGPRTKICAERGISYSACKQSKGQVIRKGPSRGWQVIEED